MKRIFPPQYSVGANRIKIKSVMDFVFHDILFLIGKLEAELFGKERALKALGGKLMLP